MDIALLNDGSLTCAVDYDKAHRNEPVRCPGCGKSVHLVAATAIVTFTYFSHNPNEARDCPYASQPPGIDLDVFASADLPNRVLMDRCHSDAQFRHDVIVNTWRLLCLGTPVGGYMKALDLYVHIADQKGLWRKVGLDDGNVAYVLLTLDSLPTTANLKPMIFQYRLCKDRRLDTFRPNAAHTHSFTISVVGRHGAHPLRSLPPSIPFGLSLSDLKIVIETYRKTHRPVV